MVKPGSKTKGRQRIQNRLIEGKARRQVTFCKRKSGLFKKASQIAVQCGAQVAVATFSDAGKVSAFGHPSVDAVLRRYAPRPGNALVSGAGDSAGVEKADREKVEALHLATEQTTEEVKAEAARMKAIGEKILETQEKAGKRFWWEADVEALGVAELPEFAGALQRLKANVLLGAEKLSSAPSPPQ